VVYALFRTRAFANGNITKDFFINHASQNVLKFNSCGQRQDCQKPPFFRVVNKNLRPQLDAGVKFFKRNLFTFEILNIEYSQN